MLGLRFVGLLLVGADVMDRLELGRALAALGAHDTNPFAEREALDVVDEAVRNPTAERSVGPFDLDPLLVDRDDHSARLEQGGPGGRGGSGSEQREREEHEQQGTRRHVPKHRPSQADP